MDGGAGLVLIVGVIMFSMLFGDQESEKEKQARRRRDQRERNRKHPFLMDELKPYTGRKVK